MNSADGSSSPKTRGTAGYRYPQPGIFIGQVAGYFSSDMVDDYVDAMSKAFDRGRGAVGFHDWSELQGYDSNARKRLTEWVLQQRSKMVEHHILVRSKLVAMGVATASMLVGGHIITSHTDRASFERALQHARSK